MRQSIKATLLSAFIFPGVGQLSNGYKKRGWFFIGSSLIITILLISEIIAKATEIVNDMQKNGLSLDASVLESKVSEAVSYSDNFYLNSIFIAFIIIWFVSLIDAYRTGSALDKT